MRPSRQCQSLYSGTHRAAARRTPLPHPAPPPPLTAHRESFTPQGKDNVEILHSTDMVPWRQVVEFISTIAVGQEYLA